MRFITVALLTATLAVANVAQPAAQAHAIDPRVTPAPRAVPVGDVDRRADWESVVNSAENKASSLANIGNTIANSVGSVAASIESSARSLAATAGDAALSSALSSASEAVRSAQSVASTATGAGAQAASSAVASAQSVASSASARAQSAAQTANPSNTQNAAARATGYASFGGVGVVGFLLGAALL